MKLFLTIVSTMFYVYCLMAIFYYQFGTGADNIIQMATYEIATIKWFIILGIGHYVITLIGKEVEREKKG